MKTSLKFFLTGIAGLALVAGSTILPAIAHLADYDQNTFDENTVNSPETGYPKSTGGFPRWYKDHSGVKLDLCLEETDLLCLAAPLPFPGSPRDFPGNFPDEAFWWTTEALTTTLPTPTSIGGFKALLVLATEAAFGNGDPEDGDQIVFNRTRIRVLGGLTTNRWYKITYPGTGLGLAIAQDLIKQMQGEIEVFSPAQYPADHLVISSEPGTTFIVWLLLA